MYERGQSSEYAYKRRGGKGEIRGTHQMKQCFWCVNEHVHKAHGYVPTRCHIGERLFAFGCSQRTGSRAFTEGRRNLGKLTEDGGKVESATGRRLVIDEDNN